ncbi:MAG: hypothetical protein A3H01_00140 [Candidatus Wildermuthbacteria bacterium RIFCSPLOWO2_12_FULL_40_9]|uniref:Uncharacterized protein n=2 Tax=Candidatus Wildermuthiibacteriota TaxID=1817923 RepID=A0A1G2RFH2_9BACT|nr:MAG: hypothetical protein A3F15_01505 [Candidatus Wildermuthbacteria bacterium RIFCSPHIGHO2_12_FULL_40_12]OHA76154.1 MAG: hypothetical protein A3H01_00140 [Candidatus Wildermuthbacteria bacterium RIFCSPLOWO2_12_FULL_40_9]
MRIKDLHYTKNPSGIIELGGVLEIDINQMFLLSLGRLDKQTLRLNLKADHREVTAYVRSKNLEEEHFLDFLQQELNKNFIGKSYNEIVNIDFES